MRILKLGSTGPDVQYLSLALDRAGYSTGGIKRIFDQNVHDALVAFQNSVGITADGVAGEVTYEYLLPYLRGYTTVILTEGDTPETLAQRYSTTPEAIRRANPMLTEYLPFAEVIVPFGFDVVPTNVDYSYELVGYILDGLIARYPIAKRESAGTSVMEKELWYITIGTGNNNVFINASHHANEWITSPVVHKFAEDYLKAISSNSNIGEESAQTLYATKKLFLMPLVNPDGVDLVTSALGESSPYYAIAQRISQDYPDIAFPSGWKANIAGTDLNLNYPASWDKAKEIKYAQGFTSPAPRDFVGSAPLSAIESRNVHNLSLAKDFALTVSMHTQGDTIYWKYQDFLPPRSEEIADELARVSGYTKAITPYESGFAGYKDWYISYYNRPGYTVEIGRGQNPLPISDFESIYPANLRLLSKALALA